MFAISKIFIFLLKPLIWIIILVLVYFINKKKNKVFAYFAIGLFLFFSNPYILKNITKIYEPKPLVIKKKYDYVIALGGYSSEHNYSRKTNFSESVDRLTEGLKLLYNGMADTLVLSGGSGSLINPNEKESQRIANYLKENNWIDSNRIIVENESRNTFENAKFCSQILKKNSSIVVVTSAFHIKRAKLCFEKNFKNSDIVFLPVDYLSDYDDKFSIDELIPNAHTLFTWEILIKEWLGYLITLLR